MEEEKKMSLLPKLNREIRFNEDIVKVEIEQQQAVSLHSHSSIHTHSPKTPAKKDAATETDKPIVDGGGGNGCGGSGNGGVNSSARRISRRYTIGSVTDDISPSPPTSLRRSKKLKRVMNLVKWKRSQSRDYAGSFSVRQEFSTRILKPNDYFFFSVFTSLFCFMPIGLIGIYFSIKSVISFHAYKFSDAIYYSNLSLKTNIVAFLIGVFFFVVSMLIYFYLMYRVVV